MHDRPGDELRKEENEGAIFTKREGLHAPGLDVDQEGDLLEGDERDAERQNDVKQNEVGAESVVDRPIDEVGIFEKAEEGDVEQNADQQHRARETRLVAPLAQPEQVRRQQVVDDDRGPDDEDIERQPPAVEYERRQDEPQRRALARD